MSFLTELKRRNVFKVAGAYLALWWVAVQITATLAPAFHLPESVLPVVTWIGVIGFPFAVLFSWIYELTPEGLKRESEVDRSQSITHVTGKRLDYIIIALLLVAIGLVAVDRFVPRSAPPATAPPIASIGSKAEVPSAATAPATTQPSPVAAPDEKSIAVLPFADMSVEKDQEYMSDGIAEELLNRLAQVPDLKVIARTSSFAFKGKEADIAEIAQKLNVAHVLEGTVRKSGSKVRITAQLIRTADSTHVWSENYDRPLDDIFSVQDEIAGAIVQALQIQLMGGQLSPRKGGTQNLEAYQLYLRGMSAWNQNTRTSLDAGAEYLEQAIKRDPGYGMAWVGLADNVMLKTDNGYLASKEGYERARQLAQHALQLSPDLAEAHAMLQYVHRTLDWDWVAAEAEGQQALAIDSTNPAALRNAGMLSYTLGRWDDAERQLREALVRDPLNPYTIWCLGTAYHLAGRFADAETTYRDLFKREPSWRWTRSYLGKTLLAESKPEEALALAQENPDEGARLILLPAFLHATGRTAEADEAMRAQIAYWGDTGAYWVAMTYAYRGNPDLALEWLERAYKQRDMTLIEIVGEPLFRNLADDPRYKAFLRKMSLPD